MPSNNQIDVTIIIPVYNEEKYIDNCLCSIIKFIEYSQENCEILLFDGGSTDKTKEIINCFTGKYDFIFLYNNPMRYQSFALNMGINKSKGQYILRLDAHAEYPSDYLVNCFNAMNKTKAENVGGICITTPSSNTYEARLIQALTTHKFGVGNSGFRTYASEGYVDTVPFGFYKKDIFKKYGLFNENLIRAQDYEFNSRIRKNGGRVYLDPSINMTYYNLSDIKKFLRKQILSQGPGNIFLWYIAPYSFVLRHSVTGLFLLFILSIIIAFTNNILFIIWLSVMILYSFASIIASFQQAIKFKEKNFVLTLPFLFFLFHIFHGLGMLLGVIQIITGRSYIQKNRKVMNGKL